MVFSSVPLYLDPPNWQQHPNQPQQLQASGHGNENQHLIQPQTVPQPAPHMVGPGGAPPIRPNSMAERARLAKIPPPEAPLKCPRCDSTNTKFCYFNNYSLAQPRHFCKTCRRYWTRGGALRNVPVGGGCRRNKRSSSKSSSSAMAASTSSSKSSLSSPTTGLGGGHMDIIGSTSMVPTIAGIPTAGGGGMSSFMASLQNFAQLGMGNLGLTFGGSLHAPTHHHALGGLTGGGEPPQLDFNVNSIVNSHHNPHIHYPSALGGGGGIGFELPTPTNNNLYSSEGVVVDNEDANDRQHHQGGNDNLPNKSCSSMMSQLAPVKTEGEGQGLNLAKQLMMGISSSTSENNQFWGNGIVGNSNVTNNVSMWTDLSGLNSSSSSHLM